MRKIEFASEPKSFFLKVKCIGCGNEQVIFSSAACNVKCLGCNKILADSGSGKILLRQNAVRALKG